MFEEKLLKKALKNKMKYTLSLLVIFFITGTIGYGIEIEEDIKIVGTEKTNWNALNNENEINNKGFIGGILKNESIINNQDVNKSVNGVFNNLGDVSIKNSGIISGDTDINKTTSKNDKAEILMRNSSNGVYGVMNASIVNAGTISGNIALKAGNANLSEDYAKSQIFAYASGNGVSVKKANIENNGLISGNGMLEGGNATGYKSVTAYASGDKIGNGIYGNEEVVLKNNGAVLGNSILKGGNAVAHNSNSTSAIDVSAAAYADATAHDSSNGVVGKNILLENNGVVSGQAIVKGGTASASGAPISVNGKPIEAVTYPYALPIANFSGNGINGETVSVMNKGVISGYVEINDGLANNKVEKRNPKYSGNGIVLKNSKENINNHGVIRGSESAIVANNFTGSINNYGILAGKEIFSNGEELKEIELKNKINQGIYVKLSTEKEVKEIIVGTSGKTDGKDILNGSTNGSIAKEAKTIQGNQNTYIKSSELTKKSDLIINGLGRENGALTVVDDVELNDSIINGYETALTINDNKSFKGTNVILNGGGLKNDITVIKGSVGDNTFVLDGKSTVNGNINLGDGNNVLTLANTVQINGNIQSGSGKDILSLGTKSPIRNVSQENLNVFNKIDGFETINANGNVTLFEKAEITGADKITLESGNLVLKVDPTIIKDGKTIGHALYGNKGTLESTGGNLLIKLNGIGVGTTVSMGETTLVSKEGQNYVKINSLVLDGKLSEDGKDLVITVVDSIPPQPVVPKPPVDTNSPGNQNPSLDSKPSITIDSLLYENLNSVYKSIVNAGEIGNMANTTLLDNKTYNDSLEGLLTLLDQIYANNPYAYTLKSTRDSLKLFEDNMSYLTIKPKKDELIVQGKAIYTGVKNDNTTSGKNYYGFDTGHRNYKTTTDTVGGLATFEYGVTDKNSVGFVLGGNHQNINFRGLSKVDGNSLYLGTFAKREIDNFKFTSGIGYQYTSIDAERKISNKYDSFATENKYHLNSLNAFVETKYTYNVKQDWTVEPKIKLSYYYIEQSEINEGYTPGKIAMKADRTDSNTMDVEAGIDFIKNIDLNSGKLKNILSLGVVNTIGDKSKGLKGYILGKEKNGTYFNIQGIELPKTSGKVSYTLELEQTNGIIYKGGMNFEFAKDYNRNISATIGVGYKF